jgi:hypothetical protein
VKDLVAEDPKLSMLQDARRGYYGPDWVRTDISKNPNEPRWYDLTTLGEWGDHVYKCAPGMGQGLGIIWQ